MTLGPTSQWPVPRRLSPRRRPTTGLQRFTRALSWVAMTTALIVLAASGGLWLYVNDINSKFHSIGALCVKDCSSRPQEISGTENFLLVGSDTRAGDNTAGALSGLADGSGGIGLSDTTMLVHISANTSRVTALSFPRDLLVERPEYTAPGGTVYRATQAKFNSAYSLGGPQLLIKQVEQLTNLKVDHYVGIDFAGFVNIVNALGGIDVCISAVPGITTNLVDPGAPSEGTLGSGFRGHVGDNHLSGTMALAFVRQRHGLPNGDIDRIQRQHRFLSAVLAKLKSAGTLLNPIKLNRVLTSLAKDVSKDNGTKLDDLVTLGQHLQGLGGDQIKFFTIPTTNGPNISGVGAVLLPVTAQARQIVQAMHDDRDPSAPEVTASPSPKASASPSPSSAPLIVAPSQISLAVRNASGTTGTATTAASDLRGLGFGVSSVTTAPTAQSATTVRYGTGRADSARTLSAALPGSVLQADPTLGASQLVLDVGSSYAGVQAVHVTGGTATTPTTSPSPSPLPPAKADTTAQAAGGCGP